MRTSPRSVLSNAHQSSAAPATAHFLASNKHVHVELKYVHVEVVKKLTVCQSYLCMRGVRPSPSCVQQDGAAVGMGQSGRVFASRLCSVRCRNVRVSGLRRESTPRWLARRFSSAVTCSASRALGAAPQLRGRKKPCGTKSAGWPRVFDRARSINQVATVVLSQT